MIKTREMLRSIQQNKFIAVSAALIIIMIAAAFFLLLNGKSQNITIEKAVDVSKEGSASKASEKADKAGSVIYVDVDGQVERPGVYELSSGSRVYEAIEKAGGLKSSADTSGINQAEPVKDGQKILIPKKGSDKAASRKTGGSAAKNEGQGKININTADSAELQTIVGIGPVTAEKIIDYRDQNGNFDKIEDIKNVSGIGDKTFEKMANDICI